MIKLWSRKFYKRNIRNNADHWIIQMTNFPLHFLLSGRAICRLPPDTGPCDGICPRYYYDYKRRTCRRFDFGCCEGNANNFKTRSQCREVCQSKCFFLFMLLKHFTWFTSDILSFVQNVQKLKAYFDLQIIISKAGSNTI